MRRPGAQPRHLRGRLAAAGLAGRVRAEGEDRGGRLVLRFVPPPGDPAADLAEPLRRLMAGFALQHEIEWHAT